MLNIFFVHLYIVSSEIVVLNNFTHSCTYVYIYILTRVTLYCPMITNFVNSRSSMENGLWFMENG